MLLCSMSMIYDLMTVSSGQTLERLLLAQVLREVPFLGHRCTSWDTGALPGTQVHCPGALLGPGALAGPVAPEQPGPDGGALLAAGRGHLDMMQVTIYLSHLFTQV